MSTSLLSLVVIMFFAMMSPGPDMLLLIKNGICYSRQNALLTVVGIAVGLSFHISVSILGLAILISGNPGVYHSVRIAGALYLMFIGFQSFREKADDLKFSADTGLSVSASLAFRDGLFCNLLNVKALLFILSVFTQLISPTIDLTRRFLYGTVLISEALLVWSLFVILIQTPAIQVKVQRYRIEFSRLFGILLISLGLKIFFD